MGVVIMELGLKTWSILDSQEDIEKKYVAMLNKKNTKLFKIYLPNGVEKTIKGYNITHALNINGYGDYKGFFVNHYVEVAQ